MFLHVCFRLPIGLPQINALQVFITPSGPAPEFIAIGEVVWKGVQRACCMEHDQAEYGVFSPSQMLRQFQTASSSKDHQEGKHRQHMADAGVPAGMQEARGKEQKRDKKENNLTSVFRKRIHDAHD